jgi:hypothetical protein
VTNVYVVGVYHNEEEMTAYWVARGSVAISQGESSTDYLAHDICRS